MDYSIGRLSILLGAAVLLSACAAPTASPPSQNDFASAGGDTARQAEWNALVDAARKEGTLVVRGASVPELRVELPRAFKERFGIEVEYLSGSPSETGAQVDRERAAGLYAVDVILTGAAGMYLSAYPGNWLDPLRPALIHPDALDGSKWPNGKLWFVDPEEQSILRYASQVSPGISINTDYVKEGEIKSWYDLLRPEYRGKIATDDPAGGSGGHGLATTLYWKLGEDYFKRLYVDQKPRVSGDARQLADLLARGVNPIALGLRDEELQELQRSGFPVTVVMDLPEVPDNITAGSGMMGLINNAPHPNAAKLFVNWAATKEGMDVLTKYGGVAGIRSDVDKSHMAPYMIPQPGRDYLDRSDWDFSVNQRLPLSSRVKELLRG